MKKRVICTILTVLMVLTVFNISAFAANNGAWTDEGNYDISWYNDQDTSFTLTTVRQVAGFAWLVNHGREFEGKTVRLEADINLSGKNWIPIGYNPVYEDSYCFRGSFDGRNYKITNMVIDLSLSERRLAVGFFGNVVDAAVQNVRIGSGSSITVTNTYSSADKEQNDIGGIVGLSDNSTIQNCDNKAAISVNSYLSNVGGIAGLSNGLIENCDNRGDITASNGAEYCHAAGIVGNQLAGTIQYCANTGSITMNSSGGSGAQAFAGGMTAYNHGAVNDCYNTGQITVNGGGHAAAGGILGVINGPVRRCYNTSAVTASDGTDASEAGGIAGNSSMDTTDMAYCTNYGTVTAKDCESCLAGGVLGQNHGSVLYCANAGTVITEKGKTLESGGLAGYNGAGKLRYCMNIAEVSAVDGETGYVGGMVGYNCGEIINCGNKAAVSARNSGNHVGGIAGVNSLQPDWFEVPGTIRNCYNSGAVTADTANINEAGGLVGVSASMLENCYNMGSVTGEILESWVGGIEGSNTTMEYQGITYEGSVVNSYWLEDTCTIPIGNNSALFSGSASFSSDGDLTPVEGHTIVNGETSLIDALNVGRTTGDVSWKIVSGQNGGYPMHIIPVTDIDISGTDSVMPGHQVQFEANVSPSDATKSVVIWSVINGTGSATIDNAGILTGVFDGTVTVRVTAAGVGTAYAEKIVNIGMIQPDPKDEVIEGQLHRTYYNPDGSINRVAIYYGADDSSGIQKINYYTAGVRTSYKMFDTDGNLTNLVELYSDGNIKKINYYNTTTGCRYAYKLYDTEGRMTHYIFTYSDGIKPQKTNYYNVNTGERTSYKLYDTQGRTTHLIDCHPGGVKPKKTNYYDVSTGVVRKSYKLYDTQGRTTHYAICYSDGIKASKMNYYDVNTGIRIAYKTYRTDGSCSCHVICDSNGNPLVATYYDKNGNVTKVVHY